MKSVSGIKLVVSSWDFWVAVAITILLSCVLPSEIPASWAKEISGLSVSLLAIVFSVFFAALAVLVSAGDNEFVKFLTEDGHYYSLLWTFRFTVLLLFVALLTSIFLFGYATYIDVQASSVNTTGYMSAWFNIAASFLALYALFAAISTSMDAIRYAELRAKYIELTMSSGKKQE